MIGDSWKGNWPSRLAVAIRSLGYSDAEEFLQQNPTLTYKALIDMFDESFAPVQLEIFFRNEMNEKRKPSIFIKDSLVRRIYKYQPKGWNVGEDSEFKKARTLANWISSIDDQFKPHAKEIAKKMNNSEAIEQGWLPQSTEDPILDEAFKDFPST